MRYGGCSVKPVLFLTGIFSCFLAAGFAQTASTTAVTASPGAAAYGTAVSLTAGVSPAGAPVSNGAGGVLLPTGTVQLFDGTVMLTGTPAPLMAGRNFTSTPFNSFLGSLDAAFISVDGQATADMNGDGLPDLLVYQSVRVGDVLQQSIEVQTFLAQVKGGYSNTAAEALVLPTQPVFDQSEFVPVLVDLNGDGKPDLLIGPAIAYGNGDGTFQQPVAIAALAGYQNTFATDVNGDGLADVVAVNTPNVQTTGMVPVQITVILNQGGGTFQAAGSYTIATGATCPCEEYPIVALSFADLNGDGKLDIVAQSYFTGVTSLPTGAPAGTAGIVSLLNEGNGTFATPVAAVFSQPPAGDAFLSTLPDLEISDFNGDGKDDLVLVYPAQEPLITGSTTDIAFLPGNGDGTFGQEKDSTLFFPTSQGQTAAAPAGNAVVVDANLDGKPDLVFATEAVVLGDGKGDFSGGAPVAASANAFPVSVGLLPPVGGGYANLVFAAGSEAAPHALVAMPDLTASAVLAPVTLSAGAHSITAMYSGDSHYAASTSQPTVVQIAPLATNIAVTSTANPGYLGEQVTISIAVTSPSGPAPTGTVALTYVAGPMSGLTSGSANLTLDAHGNASFQVASSTGSEPGSVGITVSYDGDGNHVAASATFSQVFNAAVVISPAMGTITVKSGQSASTQLSLTGTAGYMGAAKLACNGLPATATCVFNPGSVNVAGATVQIVTLTVSAGSSTTAGLAPGISTGQGLRTLACGLMAGGLLLLWPRRRWTHWAGIVVIGLGLLPMGCGGNSSNPGVNANNTPPGSYPFTIVAGGSAVPNAEYTLVVQ